MRFAATNTFVANTAMMHFAQGTHGNRLRGGKTLSTRIDKCRSLVMPPRFVRRLRNNTAQSLVLSVKLGARCGRRLAPPHSKEAHSVNMFYFF